MVVKLPDHEQPLFWESTTLTNLDDEIFHDHMKGPKVVDLYRRMKQYGRELKPYLPAQFAYRKLDVARTEAMIHSLTRMFTVDHGLPNPGEWKMVAEVVEGRLFNIQSRLDTFFCSELGPTAISRWGCCLQNGRSTPTCPRTSHPPGICRCSRDCSNRRSLSTFGRQSPGASFFRRSIV